MFSTDNGSMFITPSFTALSISAWPLSVLVTTTVFPFLSNLPAIPQGISGSNIAKYIHLIKA